MVGLTLGQHPQDVARVLSACAQLGASRNVLAERLSLAGAHEEPGDILGVMPFLPSVCRRAGRPSERCEAKKMLVELVQ